VGAKGTEQHPNFPQKTGVCESEVHSGLHSAQPDPAALVEAIGRMSEEQRAAILAALGITSEVVQ
jgi:hypothetical protein